MGCVSSCHVEPNSMTHNCLHYGSMRCFLHRRVKNRWLFQMVAILNSFQQGNGTNGQKETWSLRFVRLGHQVEKVFKFDNIDASLNPLVLHLYYQRPVWQQRQVARLYSNKTGFTTKKTDSVESVKPTNQMLPVLRSKDTL